MKSKNVGILVSIGIMSGIIGCGGGGTETETISSTVSADSAKVFASHIAKFQGCSEVDIGTLPIQIVDRISEERVDDIESRSYDINQVLTGSCGGTLTITGEHDSGTNTLVYDYNNFCHEISLKQLVLTGLSNVQNLGTPSDFGPIVYEDTISTEGRMTGSVIDDESIARALPSTFSADLSGFSLKYGSGDKTISATEATPDTVNIDSADIMFNDENYKYAVSKVSASTYIASNIVNILNGKGTYTDPELGTYTVTGDSITLPLSSMGLPVGVNGTATVTATDGTKGEIKFEDGVIVLSLDDGTAVAQVDCTELANQLVE